MATRQPFGKKHPSSGRRRSRQERHRLAHGANVKQGQPTGGRSGGPGGRQARQPARPGGQRSRSAQLHTEQRQLRWLNALVVLALTGIFVFALQGPLSGNAPPRIIQAMTIACIPLGLAMLWATRHVRPGRALALYLAIIACTGLHVRFRERDYLDTSFDFVVVLQALIFATFLATGGLALSQQAARFKKPVLVMLAILVLAALLSNIGAPDPQYSAFSTVAMMATLAFGVFCAVNLTPSDFSTVAVIGTAPIVLLSFVAYLFPGSSGDGIWVYTPDVNFRLEGIANNPIGLAVFSGILLLGLYHKIVLAERRELGWALIALVMIPIALVSLYASGSRGPSIGTAAGLILGSILVLRPFGKATVPVFIAAAALLVPLLYFTITEGMSNATLAVFARSGDAGEVETLTGRTEIWSHVLGMIPDAPLLGHGMGSPLVLLADYNPSPTFNVVQAHNIFLHSSLMIGIPGALVLIGLLVYGLFRAHNKRHAFALVMFVFFAVTGITEDFLFSNRPNWYTMLFFGLLLSVARDRAPRPKQERAASRGRQPASTEQANAMGGKPEPA